MNAIFTALVFVSLSLLSIAQSTSKTFGKWTAYYDVDPYKNTKTFTMRTPIITEGVKADLKLRFVDIDSVGNPGWYFLVLADPLPSIYTYFTKEQQNKIGQFGSVLYVNINGEMTKEYIVLIQSTQVEYMGKTECEKSFNSFKKGTDGALQYTGDPTYYKFSLTGFTQAFNYLNTQYQLVYYRKK